MSNEISEVTRRSIIDYLTASETRWSGRLQESDFLARLYDLTAIRSTDARMPNAAGDIWQHRDNWQDWENDWVFYDARFKLLHSPDDVFLKFLCETVHPVPRPDSDEARKLAEIYNNELQRDGWSIVETNNLSGKPIFSPQRGKGIPIFDEPTGWQKVDRQLQEVRVRLDTANAEEQYQTIGLLSREALISVAQEVFDPALHSSIDGVSISPTDSMRMLGAFFEKELSGSANAEIRKHAKAALDLALALQHKRTADFRMAALCAEATTSVINIVAILGQRRGRTF
jgi:hypothetical protein